MGAVINSVINDVSDILNAVLLLILTVISILELLDMYGIQIKKVKFFERKRERERKQIEKAVDEYIRGNKNLFVSNSKEYINYILTSIGIKNGQPDKIFSMINELKKVNEVIRTDENMNEAIRDLLKDPRVLIDLSKSNPERKVIYPGLKYYINLTDTMHIKGIRGNVLHILHYYIENVLAEQNLAIRDIDSLVIPTESNTILGIELANLLDIEPVIMHNKRRRIYDDQYWDGTLQPGSKVLIIHDVIFSGDNIVECIERLPKTCAIVGVVALINRTDKDKKLGNKIGKALIEATGVKVYSAMHLDDKILSDLHQEKGC